MANTEQKIIKVVDGVNPNIEATVEALVSGNPLLVRMSDSDGSGADLATEAKQDTQIAELQDIEAEVAKMVGFEIGKYNYIALTYVAAGNGAGKIETVVYKTGGAGCKDS